MRIIIIWGLILLSNSNCVQAVKVNVALDFQHVSLNSGNLLPKSRGKLRYRLQLNSIELRYGFSDSYVLIQSERV